MEVKLHCSTNIYFLTFILKLIFLWNQSKSYNKIKANNFKQCQNHKWVFKDKIIF